MSSKRSFGLVGATSVESSKGARGQTAVRQHRQRSDPMVMALESGGLDTAGVGGHSASAGRWCDNPHA